jgi:hypothetical protein
MILAKIESILAKIPAPRHVCPFAKKHWTCCRKNMEPMPEKRSGCQGEGGGEGTGFTG